MLHRRLLTLSRWLLLPLSLSLLALAGCGGSSLPAGPKGTVSGKITYNGAPVPEGSTVMFQHIESGQAATGAVQSDGTFTLRMQGNTKILAGPSKVSVAPPTTASPDESNLDDYAKIMEGGGRSAPPPVNIPDKYLSPETSDITVDVQEGANDFPIELTD